MTVFTHERQRIGHRTYLVHSFSFLNVREEKKQRRVEYEDRKKKVRFLIAWGNNLTIKLVQSQDQHKITEC